MTELTVWWKHLHDWLNWHLPMIIKFGLIKDSTYSNYPEREGDRAQTKIVLLFLKYHIYLLIFLPAGWGELLHKVKEFNYLRVFYNWKTEILDRSCWNELPLWGDCVQRWAKSSDSEGARKSSSFASKRGSWDGSGTWFGCPPGHHSWEVIQGRPNGRRPRTTGRDFISDLAWQQLNMLFEKLENVAVERDFRNILLSLLFLWTRETKWKDLSWMYSCWPGIKICCHGLSLWFSNFLSYLEVLPRVSCFTFHYLPFSVIPIF